jgi:3-(3-hydroxy-phenyl)propionate hydroxylase
MPAPPKYSSDTAGVYEVAIVGGGPVGLTLAMALSQLGVQVVLLDEGSLKKDGSRAICFSKRSLEIFGRLGVVKPMLEKGVEWNVGRVYYKDKEIDSFLLSPKRQSRYPAFINLQQY